MAHVLTIYCQKWIFQDIVDSKNLSPEHLIVKRDLY